MIPPFPKRKKTEKRGFQWLTPSTIGEIAFQEEEDQRSILSKEVEEELNEEFKEEDEDEEDVDISKPLSNVFAELHGQNYDKNIQNKTLKEGNLTNFSGVRVGR